MISPDRSAETLHRRQKLYRLAGVPQSRRLTRALLPVTFEPTQASEARGLFADWSLTAPRFIKKHGQEGLHKTFIRHIRDIEEAELLNITERGREAWQPDRIGDIFPKTLPVYDLITHEVSPSCVALAMAMKSDGNEPINIGDYLSMNVAETYIGRNILANQVNEAYVYW